MSDRIAERIAEIDDTTQKLAQENKQLKSYVDKLHEDIEKTLDPRSAPESPLMRVFDSPLVKSITNAFEGKPSDGGFADMMARVGRIQGMEIEVRRSEHRIAANEATIARLQIYRARLVVLKESSW